MRVDTAPIEFTIQDDNIHSAVAKLTAGSLATIRTRAIMASRPHLRQRRRLLSAAQRTRSHHGRLRHGRCVSGERPGRNLEERRRRSSFLGTFHVSTD